MRKKPGTLYKKLEIKRREDSLGEEKAKDSKKKTTRESKRPAVRPD